MNFDVTMLIITDPSVSKVSMAIIILEMCTIHNKYDQVTPVITYLIYHYIEQHALKITIARYVTIYSSF